MKEGRITRTREMEKPTLSFRMPYFSQEGHPMRMYAEHVELLGGEEHFAEDVPIESWDDYCRREGIPLA